MIDLAKRYECEHYCWVLPGGIECGSKLPVLFSFVTVDMFLKDAYELADRLKDKLGEHGVQIIVNGADQLQEEGFGLAQKHMVVFVTAMASLEDESTLLCGCFAIQKTLEDNWPLKTMTMLYVNRYIFDSVIEKLLWDM